MLRGGCGRRGVYICGVPGEGWEALIELPWRLATSGSKRWPALAADNGHPVWESVSTVQDMKLYKRYENA